MQLPRSVVWGWWPLIGSLFCGLTENATWLQQPCQAQSNFPVAYQIIGMNNTTSDLAALLKQLVRYNLIRRLQGS